MTMTSRERFRRSMQFKSVDRPFLQNEWYWSETIERWRRGGLVDESLLKGGDKEIFLPVNFDPIPSFEGEVLDEEGETVLVRDKWGATIRRFTDGRNAPPQFVAPAVIGKKDIEMLAERYDPNDPARLSNKIV